MSDKTNKTDGKDVEVTYYRYRLGTLGGVFPVLSTCATRQELWAKIIGTPDTEVLEFCHVGPNGVQYGISIRPSAILMIDDAYGTAAVPTRSPAVPQGRRVNRSNRIVIGQQANSQPQSPPTKAKKK